MVTPTPPEMPFAAAGIETPAYLAERHAVIDATRLNLGNLATNVMPLAAGLGTLGIMAFGMKKMFQPLWSNEK